MFFHFSRRNRFLFVDKKYNIVMRGKYLVEVALSLNNKQQSLKKVLTNINKVIIGKDETITLSLTALLAQGHVLLEDIPGVGKTMLVRALAKSLNCSFNRIQFTPDLLPSDITGVSIFNPNTRALEYRRGTITEDIIST